MSAPNLIGVVLRPLNSRFEPWKGVWKVNEPKFGRIITKTSIASIRLYLWGVCMTILKV